MLVKDIENTLSIFSTPVKAVFEENIGKSIVHAYRYLDESYERYESLYALATNKIFHLSENITQSDKLSIIRYLVKEGFNTEFYYFSSDIRDTLLLNVGKYVTFLNSYDLASRIVGDIDHTFAAIIFDYERLSYYKDLDTLFLTQRATSFSSQVEVSDKIKEFISENVLSYIDQYDKEFYSKEDFYFRGDDYNGEILNDDISTKISAFITKNQFSPIDLQLMGISLFNYLIYDEIDLIAQEAIIFDKFNSFEYYTNILIRILLDENIDKEVDIEDWFVQLLNISVRMQVLASIYAEESGEPIDPTDPTLNVVELVTEIINTKQFINNYRLEGDMTIDDNTISASYISESYNDEIRKDLDALLGTLYERGITYIVYEGSRYIWPEEPVPEEPSEETEDIEEPSVDTEEPVEEEQSTPVIGDYSNWVSSDKVLVDEVVEDLSKDSVNSVTIYFNNKKFIYKIILDATIDATDEDIDDIINQVYGDDEDDQSLDGDSANLINNSESNSSENN